MSESVGKISLDLEVQGSLESQIIKAAENVGKQLRNAISGKDIADFSDMGKSADKVADKIEKTMTDTFHNIDSQVEKLGAKIDSVLTKAMERFTKASGSIPDASDVGKTNDAASSGTSTRGPPTVKMPSIKLDQTADMLNQQMEHINQVIENVGKQIDIHQQKLDSLKETYSRTFSEEKKIGIQEQIVKTEGSIIALTGKMETLGYQYDALGQKALNLNSAQQSINNVKPQLDMSGITLGTAQATNVVSTLKAQIGALGRVAGEVAGNALRGFFNVIKSGANKIPEIGKKIQSLASRIRSAGNSGNQASGNFQRMFTTLLKYRLILPAITRLLRNMFSSLWKSLKTNEDFAASLNQIKSNLQVAFQPIYQAILPALNAFMSALAKLTGYIAALTSSLFGMSLQASVSATKSLNAAKDAVSGYGSSAKQAAKDALGLFSFDELNTLPKKDDSSGGGGASGTEITMPELGNSAAVIDGFAAKIREAFLNKDWEELGSVIGSALNTGIAKFADFVDWDRVGGKITAVVDGITRTLNSLVSSIDWNLLGTAIGKGANTVVNTLNLLITGVDWGNIGASLANGLNGLVNEVDWGNLGSLLGKKYMILWDTAHGFVTNLDWGSIGTSLGEALNGAIQSIDLAKIGSTISTAVLGLLDMLATAIKTVDWYGLGKNVAAGLAAIDWTGIVKNLAGLIGKAIGGLGLLLWGAIEDCVKAVGDYFNQKFEECGGNVVLGLLKGIWDGLVGIVTWLYDNVVAPIVNGIKEMFGIQSPSTVFAEIGSFMIEGLMQGILALIAGVSELFVNMWDNVKLIFDTAIALVQDLINTGFTFIRDNIDEILSTIREIITNVWTGIKNTISTTINNIKLGISTVLNSIRSLWSNIWTGMKNTVVNIFNGIWSGIKNVINKILSGVESMANGVVRGINGMIGALNNIKFSVPDWVPGLGGKSFGINIPSMSEVHIPKLAQGGYTKPNTPQLAMIGDNRHQGEIVAPEDKIYEVSFRAMTDAMKPLLSVLTSLASQRVDGANGEIKLYVSGELAPLFRWLKIELDKTGNLIGNNFEVVQS